MKHLIQLIKRNKVLTFFIVLVLGVSIAVIYSRSNRNNHADNDMVKLTAKAILLEGGWGYEVLADGKVYIRQEYIPAIQGKRRFKNQKEAEFVANKVIEKLVKNRGQLPAVTAEELRQWGVIPKEQM